MHDIVDDPLTHVMKLFFVTGAPPADFINRNVDDAGTAFDLQLSILFCHSC